MMPDESEAPEESQICQFVNWIIDQSVTGFPPLSSSENLAIEYLIDESYPSNDDRVWSLINWEASKNFASGFVTGLGGLLTLPISIPAAFGASWLIQARMAGAIARIHGHNLASDRIRTFILLSLLGDAGKEVLKQAGCAVAMKVGTKLIEQIPGKLFIEINKAIGFRLITKAGETGVFNMMKVVPGVGGVVCGTIDAAACRMVGHTAHNWFRPNAEDVPPDAQDDPTDA